jgi:DNA-binding MurR/RpiR family transcriptional regulator
VVADSIYQLINNNLESLTGSEKKVARALIAQYPGAGLQSIQKLSEQAGVSAPTVLRCVAKLGFESYKTFQSTLVSEIGEREVSTLEQLKRRSDGVSEEKLIFHCLDFMQSSIEASFKKISGATYWKAVELLGDTKRRVHCVGGRFSQTLAQYLMVHLHQIRQNCHFLPADQYWRALELTTIKKNDLFVFFDFRRYQEDVIALAGHVADKGGEIILITDPYYSPIAEISHCVFPTEVSGPSAYDSYVPALVLIEILIAGLVERNGACIRKRMEEQERLFEKLALDSPRE